MKLIVGLGNPGKEYEGTRHNIGFMSLDFLSSKYNFEFSKEKFGGLYAEIIINGEKIILLKPQKYINLSGEVLIQYVRFFKIEIADILIICDDMDLEVGTYKLRYKGGSAGHNGLKNIEYHLGTNEYKRLKIGISKDKNIDTVNYVLGKLSKEDVNKVNPIFEKLPFIIEDLTQITFDNIMNKYN